MANKLPSKPVPKKPAPQAFDVGVLLDGIAQEKEQREREVVTIFMTLDPSILPIFIETPATRTTITL